MWVCECGFVNQTSNKKCRGQTEAGKCGKPRPDDVLPPQKTLGKHVRDYCPNCKRHTDFTRYNIHKNRWTCTVCHRRTKMKGKPVPEPTPDVDFIPTFFKVN
jgi:hypothetical protein